MGPFAWLAGRWTPEFEYRDRLADEVEDIAYESTRIGTRRGFLMGVLVGAILAVVGVAAYKSSGLETAPSAAPTAQHSPQSATSPQPTSEDLALLRRENEQLKAELARGKAASAVPAREKRTAETKAPVAKREVPEPMPTKPAVRERITKPDVKSRPSDSAIATPIPSNCRQEGVCDPTGP
jgi:hypothetical protein